MYKHFSFLYFPVFIRDDKVISFLIKYDLQYVKKVYFIYFIPYSPSLWWPEPEKKILEIKFGG